MEVILLQKVANLGNIGDRVKVKSGFGRNFLLPKGKATLATPANVAKFEARRAELEKAAREQLSGPPKSAPKRSKDFKLTITREGGQRRQAVRLDRHGGHRRSAATRAELQASQRSEVRLPNGPLRTRRRARRESAPARRRRRRSCR